MDAARSQDPNRSSYRGPPCPGFRTLEALFRTLDASLPDSGISGRDATTHLVREACAADPAPPSSHPTGPVVPRPSADQRLARVADIRCTYGPDHRNVGALLPSAHAEPLTTLPLLSTETRMASSRTARAARRKPIRRPVRHHFGCRSAIPSAAQPDGRFAPLYRSRGTTGSRERPHGRPWPRHRQL